MLALTTGIGIRNPLLVCSSYLEICVLYYLHNVRNIVSNQFRYLYN